MEIVGYRIYIILLAVVVIALIIYVRKIKRQLSEVSVIVDEIKDGNMSRRLIIDEKSPAANLCYKINEVVIQSKSELTKHKRAEKLYRQLVTSLSHDIRTPLASLSGYLEAIHLGYITEDEMQHYIETSLNKALDLKYYVDTLFEWLKIESGERVFHFEDIDIFEYTREIVAEWIPQFEDTNISYDVSIPEHGLVVTIDKVAYKRIVDNLFQNALIHSHTQLLTIITGSFDNTFYFELKDTGVGISDADLPHIFERLYKCNTARGVIGNGLGLSIVKELVKGLHGEISVQSQEGKGTAFKVLVPLSTFKNQE